MDDPGRADRRLDDLLRKATEASFRGWEFSWLGDRYRTTPTDWDYRAIVGAVGRRAGSLVDMGTGGGEFLAGIHPLPPRTVATEAHPPNWPVAAARLAARRIPVVAVEPCPNNTRWEGAGGRLPVRTGSVEVVINRHDAYSPAEVARVLRPGGTFITQQVGGDDAAELLDWFDRSPPSGPAWNLGYATSQLQAVGLHVTDGAESRLGASFADVGALAYYLLAVPWQVPGFDVTRDRRHLARLHTTHEGAGSPIEVTSHRFWLAATKPASAHR